MYKILILEDQKREAKREAKRMKEILDAVDSPKKVLIANNIEQAQEIVDNYKIDVFLLDINLPDGTGVEFAKKLRQTEQYEFSWIIFITAFEKYALEAIKKAHCYSYIIKPYDEEEVVETVMGVLDKRVNTYIPKDFLRFKTGKINIKIPYNEIVYIEALNRKCQVHTINHIYETARTSLKKIVSNITDEKLVQCHRSYVVNVSFIKSFDKNYRGSEIEMMCDKTKIAVGANFVERVDKLFKKKS